MKTSYKFWYVKKDDDGNIDEVTVRFYEGDIITETREITDPATKEVFTSDITEYKRLKRLQKSDLPHIKNEFVQEGNGNECVVYTNKDFGQTKELDDVILFLNSQLLLDPNREAEDTQSVVDIDKLNNQEIK